MVLFRAPIHDTVEFKLDYHYSPSIVFSDAEFLDGKEVVSALNEFAEIVEGIVMAIEAESTRLGLF
jgi:hypothetical protein